jgi:hypothetical protein
VARLKCTRFVLKMPHSPSPYLRANLLSRLFQRSEDWYSTIRLSFPFASSWISHLVTRSRNQKSLDPHDLYELLPEYQSDRLAQELEDNWFDDRKRYPNDPSLLRATARTMGWRPIVIGLLLIPWVGYFLIAYVFVIRWFTQMILCIAQPLFLTFLMDFFEPCSTMPLSHAWLLAIACVLTPIISSFFRNQAS